MSHTLRDQLLGLGFKAPAKPERKPDQKPGHKAKPDGGHARGDRKGGHPQGQGKPPRQAPQAHKPRTRDDIDLAKAYAIRAQREKDERIEAERQRQEEARRRREAKSQLATLLQGKSLNVADAEIARHFNYGGKIKRVYVTAPQLKALNAGELGVVQLDGRYLLVDAELLAQAEAVFPPAVALRVDPAAPATDDPYASPEFQVPDDLVW